MGLIDTIKELASTAQKVGQIELYRQILDLQGQALELAEDRARLRSELEAIRQSADVRVRLLFHDNRYWLRRDGATPDGPFCSGCMDSKERLVRLYHKIHDPDGETRYFNECPSCQQILWGQGNTPP
jgi:hypothetical protein